jgi:MFS family permease
MPEGMPMRIDSRFGAPGASASATSVPAMRAATPVQSEAVNGSARCGCPFERKRAVRSTSLLAIVHAGFSYVGGLLADRFPKSRLLAGGYALAALMALGIMFSPADFWLLALVFMLGGVQVAIEETLEDSFCAELVEPAQHGMAFGVLATVNGAGDFLSSVIVGLLWSAFGPTLAFGYSAFLFTAGAVLVARIR